MDSTIPKDFKKQVLEYYCCLLDSKNYKFPCHLSQKVMLTWFGRTIIGRESVSHFLFKQLGVSAHNLVQVAQCKYVYQKNSVEMDEDSPSSSASKDYVLAIDCQDSGFDSMLNESFCSNSSNDSSIMTPVSRSLCNAMDIMAIRSPELSSTPPDQRTYVDYIPIYRNMESDIRSGWLNSEGEVTFSGCEEQNEGFWTRKCGLRLEYKCGVDISSTVVFTSISYYDDIPCRKNLLNMFDQFV